MNHIYNGTEGINSFNLEEWYKIFRSYAYVCKKLSEDNNIDESIKIGIDTVQLYNDIVEQLKKDKILNKTDLKIAQDKFRSTKIFSNKKYQELNLIKTIYLGLADAYRAKAEEFYNKRDYIKALEYSKNAILYNPQGVFTNFTLAKTLGELKANKEAADSYEKTLFYDKNYNEGRRLIAELSRTDEYLDLDKSTRFYKEYLERTKGNESSWIGYGSNCYRLGLREECAKSCEKALESNPATLNAVTMYMLNLIKIEGYTQKEIKEITEKFVENYIKAAKIKKYAFNFDKRKKDPNKKLKIGYLSSDLKDHAVSRFFLPVVQNHDTKKFDIYLYSLNGKEDAVTKKYRECNVHFIECYGLNDQELSKRIYNDEIDILIDLNVHTGGAKTILMAQKLAPVQGIYLGYPNTSGVDAIDYILTDRNTILPEEADLYTEKPAYIEAGYEVVNPYPNRLPETSPAPYIKNKYITLGVYNATAKVTDEMIGVWAQILKRAKNTKILFQYINYYTQENQKRIIDEFKKYGIKQNRIIFLGKDSNTHYNSMAQADIALDTFPYSGTSTTVDSLLMGLPIICMQGYHATSRPTSRMLKQLGLTELIAPDFEGYIQRALRLIKNPKLISIYRETLRNKLRSSKLADYKGFTYSLEKTYQKMWQEYCNK